MQAITVQKAVRPMILRSTSNFRTSRNVREALTRVAFPCDSYIGAQFYNARGTGNTGTTASDWRRFLR